MAPSSSLSCNSKYDVFLSFRGEDVRKGFLSHVRKELQRTGIIAFVDDKIKRGESVGPVLVEAIRQSRVAVVLLSRNYTSSSWCLDELVEIMKCREKFGQTVMTIFYEVDPSHVRKQTGDFGKTFVETCVGRTEEVKQAWRQALEDVAGIAGHHSSNCDNEAQMIDKVASDVTAVLGFTPSKDFDDFVGIGAHIWKIKSKLNLQSEEVKVIGILGPPGIGKTTTARVLYSQLSRGFSFSTFLENIRGSYEKPCGNDHQLKLRFHNNLLYEIFNQSFEVGHLGVAQKMLSDKKVLVVFDNVDSWWQLEEMANKRGWFGPGSIVIITTEDRKLFKALKLGINHIYKMKFPTSTESLQIFCQYAFGQESPETGFEQLAWEVTWLAGDLPLGLRVMGSYLRGMSRNEWIDALPRLRSSLDREINATLRFSYDVLSDKDKTLFLYIACFFSKFSYNLKVDSVKRLLEKSCLDVNHGLQILAEKSLISTSSRHVSMHCLLQRMGREIVKEKSLEEPGKRQFLWDTTEIIELLEENTGTGKVLGIFLDTSEGEEIRISKSSFDEMNNLQFLHVSPDNLCIPEGLNCLPDKLRLIHWNYCPLRFWPSKFSGKFLVELIMQNSKFEKLWEGNQPLQCLKLMDLSDSEYLKEIPDLTKATSLEKLDLNNCEGLLELTSSIGNATKLKVCRLDSCLLLKELPSSIGRLISLEKLNLRFCSSLKARSVFSILENLSGCSSLKELNLSNTDVKELPPSMSTWSCLYKLDMSHCRNLKKFPNVPDSIEELELCETRIKEVPPWINKLFRLRRLSMYGCKKLKKISPNISKLENLVFLSLCTSSLFDGIWHDPRLFKASIEWGPDHLHRRWTLESDFDVHYILPRCLPEKALSSPVSLRFEAEGLKTIPDCITSLSGLSNLDITKCRKLVALPRLSGSLLSIDATYCASLERIDSYFQNPNICLNFAHCFSLNQEARKLIETSACKYAFLPGKEVPAHFSHRATSCCLTINLTPTPLPSSFRFKACILLSKDSINLEDHNDDDDEEHFFIRDDEEQDNLLMHLSYCFIGEQNNLTVRSESNQLHYMPPQLSFSEHLYIFEESFSLNQNCSEAEEATFSELSFVFRVHDKTWKVKGCGVRFLEAPHCNTDGNADDYNDDDGDGGKDETDDDGEDLLKLVKRYLDRKKKEKSDVRRVKRLT